MSTRARILVALAFVIAWVAPVSTPAAAGNQTFRTRTTDIGRVVELSRRGQAHSTADRCFVKYAQRRRNAPERIRGPRRIPCSTWEECKVGDRLIQYDYWTVDANGRTILGPNNTGQVTYCD